MKFNYLPLSTLQMNFNDLPLSTLQMNFNDLPLSTLRKALSLSTLPMLYQKSATINNSKALQIASFKKKQFWQSSATLPMLCQKSATVNNSSATVHTAIVSKKNCNCAKALPRCQCLPMLCQKSATVNNGKALQLSILIFFKKLQLCQSYALPTLAKFCVVWSKWRGARNVAQIWTNYRRR